MTTRSFTASLLAASLISLLAACGGGGDAGDPDGGAARQAGPAGSDSSDDAGGSRAQQSSNWSGYVQTGQPNSFTRISGSWTVPALQCPSSGSTASATWTGIGGGSAADPTLIQAGTAQSCEDGAAGYSAWWELIPAPAITAGEGLLDAQDYPVNPGDQISVSIDGGSVLVWNITIQNRTRGWTFNITVPYLSAGATAEWIEEAPLSAGISGVGQDTLSNFGRVGFYALTVNGANPGLTAAQRVVMVDSNNDVVANPSNPAAGGDGFDLCFGSAACR